MQQSLSAPSVMLTKAVLIYVPAQQDQYYRPYSGHLTGDNVNAALAATNGGAIITPTAMAGVAGSILSPSFTPEAPVQLPNGFNEGRFAFLLEITVSSIFGTEREIIRGFTNHAGVTPSGAIDPSMEFHVNTKMTIKDIPVTGAHGVGVRHVMKNDQAYLVEIPEYRGAISLRPEDAVAWGQTAVMRSGEHEIHDTRCSLTGLSKMSETKHAIPAHYLSDICNGYIRGNNPYREVYDPDNEQEGVDLYGDTLCHVRSESLQGSYFYNALHNSMNPRSSHTFTFNEINAVWPKPNSFWRKQMPLPGTTLTSPREFTEHWHGATLETSIAFSLTHILPALMSNIMLLKLNISISNMTYGNQVQIVIIDYVEIAEGTFTQALAQFLKGQIELDIVHGLLLPKVGLFDIQMDIDVLLTSYFNISLNGGDKVPYCAPMFCDSYYSPMIGLDSSNIIGITESVETLTAELTRDSSNPWRPTLADFNNPWLGDSTPQLGNSGYPVNTLPVMSSNAPPRSKFNTY